MTAVRTLRVVLPARERVIRMSAPVEPWLTPPQAAEYLHISVTSLSQWTNRDDNAVPSHCPSPNVVRYHRAELDAWMLRQRGRSSAA